MSRYERLSTHIKELNHVISLNTFLLPFHETTMNTAVALAETSSSSPDHYETVHVHEVYNAIADHFSSTRYKPWPVVAAFLESIPVGSVGLDAGTGNGKYLISPDHLEGKFWTIGLDRSERLLEIARRAGHRDRECVLGDVLHTCWRDGVFVRLIFSLSYLFAPERVPTIGLCDIHCNYPSSFNIGKAKEIYPGETLQCLPKVRGDSERIAQSLLRSLSPSHGRALIYVWAVQQDDLSKRAIPVATRNEAREPGSGQDVFVPWVLSSGQGQGREAKNQPISDEQIVNPVFNRYYHMFEQGELRVLVLAAAHELGIFSDPAENIEGHIEAQTGSSCIEIVKDGWERSNFYVELRLLKK